MSTMTRTDIHRPSAPEFDPENYEVFDFADFHPEDGFRPVQTVSRLVGEGWSFGGAPHPSGQCSHCGARLRYAALMGHVPTKTLLWVGETCLDNRFSVTAAEFQRLRKEGALNAERRNKAAALADLLAEHPVLVWASYAHNIASSGAEEYWTAGWMGETMFATKAEAQAEIASWPTWQQEQSEGAIMHYKHGTTWSEKTRTTWETSTLADIWHKIVRYGDPSDKQIAFVERLVQKLQDAEEARIAREAQAEALAAQGVEVPTGRVVVEGTVVSTKVVESMYGITLKMLVQNDEGWKVWGTVPSSIDVEKGTRVRFTATVEQSNDDSLFGFFKRPSKAETI